MQTIRTWSASHGLNETLMHLKANGIESDSRNGRVVRLLGPVLIEHTNPWDCVLNSQIRDANPFLHLAEILFFFKQEYLVHSLAHIVPRMKDFTDDGYQLNAPYGKRLGKQIEDLVDHLNANSNTRRAVVNTWRNNDINKKSNDLPCNTQFMFEITDSARLNMTSINRSNDAIWGLWGVNCVVFAYFQRYIAAATGYKIGKWYHFSNNLHAYKDGPGGKVYGRVENGLPDGNMFLWEDYLPMEIGSFRKDLNKINLWSPLEKYECIDWFLKPRLAYDSLMIRDLFYPAFCCYDAYRSSDVDLALSWTHEIIDVAWRTAIESWLLNPRRKK